MAGRRKEESAAEPPIYLPPEFKRRLGRAPSEIRETFKELAFESAHMLGGLLTDSGISSSERLKLIDLIVKHGMGPKIEYTLNNPEVFEIVGEVAAKHMSPETYRAFRADLEDRFRDS